MLKPCHLHYCFVGHAGSLHFPCDVQCLFGTTLKTGGVHHVVLYHLVLKVPLYDVDGVDFLYFIVFVAEAYVVGDHFGDTVEHTLDEMDLARQLHLDDDELATAVACHDIDAVVLVVDVILVALAFEDLLNFNLFADEDGHEAFQHVEIGLVAQHALGGPVKTDV